MGGRLKYPPRRCRQGRGRRDVSWISSCCILQQLVGGENGENTQGTQTGQRPPPSTGRCMHRTGMPHANQRRALRAYIHRAPASSTQLRPAAPSCTEMHRAQPSSTRAQKPMFVGAMWLPPSPKRPCHRIMLSRVGESVEVETRSVVLASSKSAIAIGRSLAPLAAAPPAPPGWFGFGFGFGFGFASDSGSGSGSGSGYG